MDYANILNEAHTAGRLAAQACKPTPMHIVQADLYGRPLPGAPIETIDDGPCGFAWVQFKGNTAFGRWCKKQGIARSGYPTGLTIWISDYNQSMERKEAHARAAAKVLRDHGITDAYAGSRMD